MEQSLCGETPAGNKFQGQMLKNHNRRVTPIIPYGSVSAAPCSFRHLSPTAGGYTIINNFGNACDPSENEPGVYVIIKEMQI